MSLTAYKQLDLNLNGELARQLFEKADSESAAALVALTAPYDAGMNRPAFVTPAMVTWFQHAIAPVRGDAIREIMPRFTEISLGQGQRGFLLEAERERLVSEKTAQITNERNAFFANGQIHRLEEQLQRVTLDYEHKKAIEGGREANEWNPWLYVVLLMLLALPEFPLNTIGFLALGNFITPAMAYAMTLAVALGIGFSSHIVGETIKQWGKRFGRGVSGPDKFRYGRTLAIGSVLFSVAFGVITTVRYIYFQNALQTAMFSSGSDGGPNYLTVFGTVGGNLLIWLIGLAFAYMAHDIIPDFGRLFRIMIRLQHKLDVKYKKNLQHDINLYKDQAAQADVNVVRREQHELANRPEYQAARDLFGQLQAIDGRVEAILNSYRTKLGEQISKSNPKLLFTVNDIELPRRDIMRQLTFPDYALIRMELKYA